MEDETRVVPGEGTMIAAHTRSAPAWIRFGGLLAASGGMVWTLSFIGDMLREERIVALFGFAEHHWRLFLGPAVVFFLVALVAFHALHSRGTRLGRVGLGITALALSTLLVGCVTDVLEFASWIELPDGLHGMSWSATGIGWLATPAGLLFLGVSGWRARRASPWTPGVAFAFGSLMILLIVQGVVVLLVTGDPTQEGWLITPLVTFGLGWMALGYALWWERVPVRERVGSDSVR